MPLNKDVIRRVAGAGLVATAVFVAHFEGQKNVAYVDPVGVVTICAGHTGTGLDGKPLRLGQSATDDVCSYLLGQDVKKADAIVRKYAKVPLSDGESLAYTSFVLNEGEGHFRSSTLFRQLNNGNRQAACAQLLVWDKGTVSGKLVVLPGLVTRRKAEHQECVSSNP